MYMHVYGFVYMYVYMYVYVNVDIYIFLIFCTSVTFQYYTHLALLLIQPVGCNMLIKNIIIITTSPDATEDRLPAERLYAVVGWMDYLYGVGS